MQGNPSLHANAAPYGKGLRQTFSIGAFSIILSITMKISFSLIKPKSKDTALVSWKKQKQSEVLLLSSGQRSIVLGVTEPEKLTRRKLVIFSRQIITLAKANQIKKIAFKFEDLSFSKLKISREETAELLATNFEMANFESVKYKSKPKEGWGFIEGIIVAGNVSPGVKKAFAKGQTIGQEVNACRVLANTPGGEMTPDVLAKEAVKAARGTGVKVKVLGLREIERLKMGGVLGVAKGADEPPRFIILEYLKGGREKPIVLVGKGVTFDSGGLQIKPGEHMYEMHMDMSGGAAVIHAVVLAAKLKLKKNIIGLVPAVENIPSGTAFRPGDVLKTMSGKTVEIMHTDAEGRVILADALTYAERYKPRLVVDVATLTGAAVAALGERASAIFSKDEKLINLFRDLGEISGDYVWPLPLWDEYEEDVKGTFGDISNSSKTRYGGAINGAIFLYQFAKIFPWVHIDMAPRMTSIEGEHLAKGAAGAPVRLLIKLLERY
ncbi:MAG: leucyl aminopeptidase family protein [bacterium]|nr:leucyl aminopeptidase family protein [bacterium]